MLFRSFSLAVVLAAATTAAGYQDSSLRRSNAPQEPKRPSVTSSKTGTRTTYFPPRNSDTSTGAEVTSKTDAASLQPAAGSQAKKSAQVPAKPITPVPAKPSNAGAQRAVHVERAAAPSKRTVTPASFVDRGSEGDAGFDAYLDNAVAPEPRRLPVRKPAPQPARPVTEPEFEVDEPQPMDRGAKSVGTAAAPARVLAMDTAPEGNQAPGISLEWVSRGEFNAGRETTLELQVRNTSKFSVSGVLAEVSAPAGCDFTEIMPRPRNADGVMSWEMGELKPGEQRSIIFRFTPNAPGDARMTAAVQITSSTAYSFSILEPKLELTLEGPANAEVGQAAGYLMRVSNPGTGTAENVVIRAKIPEGLEHRSGDTLQIEIGTLNPGESRQAKLNLSTIRGGMFALDVRAEAEGGLMHTASAEITVSEPRLLAAIRGPAQETSGRTSDYRLQISNSGSVPSVNVRARYRVPEGFEFVSANRGGRYSKADSSIEWFVGTLQPDETSEFQLTLKAIRTGSATHQAGAISELGQVTTCEHSTAVEGTANLSLHVDGGSGRIKPGTECVREIRIANSGTQAAKGVGISCELPAGLELLDVSGPSEYIAENGVLVFRSLPEIAPGGDAVYAIRLKCLRAGEHRLRLRVASSSLSDPLIGEETVRVAE